ncbi:MAG: hypothetical protein JJE52_02485 [Acidimicrobiia bacterium]|nr:hypothetical protein [Acidimicrobiia bacterium]
MSDARTTLLHDWLRTHHGVITRRRLIEIGFTRSAIGWLLRRHQLRPIWDGVYLDGTHDLGRLQLMTAICQRYPLAAIAFTTAGREWGYRGMLDPRIHVLMPHATTPELSGIDGVVIHRCRRIDPVDLAGRRPDGVRLTSPPRTLFDCAALLDVGAAASAVEQALAERRCAMVTLLATLTRLRHPNRPGAREFEAVLNSRSELRGAARSTLEITVREAIAAAGLPAPVLNMRFRLTTGDPIEIDLAWPDYQLAVEVDHPFWHDREAEAAKDKRRDRKLAAMGWLSVRLSQMDVDHRLVEAVGDIADVLVQRGWDSAAA